MRKCEKNRWKNAIEFSANQNSTWIIFIGSLLIKRWGVQKCVINFNSETEHKIRTFSIFESIALKIALWKTWVIFTCNSASLLTLYLPLQQQWIYCVVNHGSQSKKLPKRLDRTQVSFANYGTFLLVLIFTKKSTLKINFLFLASKTGSPNALK